MQAFVLIGYNSVPLPGGVGAFEYLYLHIYGLLFENAFILAAMMVTRTISYYILYRSERNDDARLSYTYHQKKKERKYTAREK